MSNEEATMDGQGDLLRDDVCGLRHASPKDFCFGRAATYRHKGNVNTVRRARLLAVAALSAVILLPSARAETPPDIAHLRTEQADAVFFATLPQNPCIEVSLLVIVDHTEEIEPKPATLENQAVLLIRSFDTCLHKTLIIGNGTGEADFRLESALSSATLNSTVDFLNLSNGSLLTIDVHLTWLAAGNPRGAGSETFIPVPDALVTFQGIERPAVAAGSVVIRKSASDQGLADLNLIPASSQDAEMAIGRYTFILLPLAIPGNPEGR